ncbi:hypothetical protein [Calothrix sp. NIES-3974]|uniref:hypothetical protein n=1 Tax=Calothrix sp. NIES-3974 TaxID=2005462 RepID=UPI000B613F26|nr:hypothetical protein [Calothrix sp. NIES-3974]BAZ05242.1 hypothetical protein NIES3974_18880 [Calothrix sp. NIES-3974]
MQHIDKLLVTENSNLAWVLRLGLLGLRTQLQQARNQATVSDPGIEKCDALLRELDVMLEPNSSISSSIQSATPKPLQWEDVFEPVASDFQLASLAMTLKSDPELKPYIGEYEFASDNDGDLWNEIQRLLLRLPERLVLIWRRRLQEILPTLDTQEDTQTRKLLPFTRSELIYPGLTGKIQTSGLALSDKIAIAPQLLKSKSSSDTDIDFLAAVVSTCLKFIQLDAQLFHVLKSVDRFGIRPVHTEPERSKYATALIERFRRVQSTTHSTDPAVTLRARLDLDEAIHSLVYMPPCDRYSWWGKLQGEARRTLDPVIERTRNAGYQIQIRPLWGTYADVYTWSKDDLQINCGGVPGEVAACLRVYAKINDEVLPGRVLFYAA